MPQVFLIPFFKWVENYVTSPLKDTLIKCELEYFNSTSAKMFFQIFLEFEKINSSDKSVSMLWYYETGDQLIEEKGIEYKEVLKMPVEVIEIN